MTKLNYDVSTIEAAKILTKYENYGERNDKNQKTAEEIARLKASIKVDGIKEPLHCDTFLQLISGFTRLRLIKELIEEGLLIDVPVIIHGEIDLSTMNIHAVKLLQNKHNTRVKVDPNKIMKLMKDCYNVGNMTLQEIADETGYDIKEVRVNVGLIDDDNTKRFWEHGVSKNSIKVYCDKVKSNPVLSSDKVFVSLFLNKDNIVVYNGKELEQRVKLHINKMKDKDLKGVVKQKFVFKPVVSQQAISERQSSILSDCDTIMNNLDHVGDEELKGVLITLISNVQSVYGLDAESKQRQKQEFNELLKVATEKKTKLASTLINTSKSIAKLEGEGKEEEKETKTEEK